MKHADFKAAWWLKSPHLQTLWPVYFKRRHKLDLITEQVELDDGDFLDLCWSRKRSDKIVLVLHGLEGSISSHYINGIIYQLERSGFCPVLMHFRGCSDRINRLARAYHSGETGDLAFIIDHIKNKTGQTPYAAVGYSLGANVLLKWLGETGKDNPLKKAVAVSVPFRLHDAAKRLEKGVSQIYREHLLKSLRETYLEKFDKKSSGIESPLDVDVARLKSFWDYDDKVTAPLHGFSGAQEYYDKCSSRQFLKHIEVTTLVVHARDDPFMFAATVPDKKEISKNIELLITANGGHVGFVAGVLPFFSTYWCEDKIVDFLSTS